MAANVRKQARLGADFALTYPFLLFLPYFIRTTITVLRQLLLHNATAYAMILCLSVTSQYCAR